LCAFGALDDLRRAVARRDASGGDIFAQEKQGQKDGGEIFRHGGKCVGLELSNQFCRDFRSG
jgi:hypothetical protein